jgi:hypothetical protein
MEDERDFYLLPEDYEHSEIDVATDAMIEDGDAGWEADDERYSVFHDPGGRSSLYAATEDDPRIYPCPDCGEPNRLTLRDMRAHHCCNACADRNEAGY